MLKPYQDTSGGLEDMPTTIGGRTYYRTLEACQIAGVSRATLHRWLKAGVIDDVVRKDRRGWRLFTEDDVNRIKAEAGRINRFIAHG